MRNCSSPAKGSAEARRARASARRGFGATSASRRVHGGGWTRTPRRDGWLRCPWPDGSADGRQLIRAGYGLVALDVDRDAERRFVDEFGAASGRDASAFAAAGVVITMLPDGRAVQDALLGEGIADALVMGTVVVDMSSSSPHDTRKLGRELAGRSIALIDAPVSGGVARDRRNPGDHDRCRRRGRSRSRAAGAGRVGASGLSYRSVRIGPRDEGAQQLLCRRMTPGLRARSAA